jgi:serine/threonine-protein kinase
MTVTILGPYRLDRELGSGGMGKVWAATVQGRVPGLAEGTRVALKVVHPHLLETPGFFKRFLREAEIGKSVVHENVVRTYDCDSLSMDGRRADFLVMEYVEGQTLRGLLAELERVPEELCRHVGREVAKGLAAIHAADRVDRARRPRCVPACARNRFRPRWRSAGSTEPRPPGEEPHDVLLPKAARTPGVASCSARRRPPR